MLSPHEQINGMENHVIALWKYEEEVDDMDDEEEEEGDDMDMTGYVRPTADQLTPGVMVIAERGGSFVSASVHGPSKKKADQWAVKFDDDGKVFARPLDQIMVPPPVQEPYIHIYSCYIR